MNTMSISRQNSTGGPITNSLFICKYEGGVSKPWAQRLSDGGMEQHMWKRKSLWNVVDLPAGQPEGAAQQVLGFIIFFNRMTLVAANPADVRVTPIETQCMLGTSDTESGVVAFF